MADQTRRSKVADAGAGLEIWRVHIDELREQTKNARTMSAEMFERLTENIRDSGRLESLPFCAMLPDGKLEIVSGHHRVRAARAANITECLVLIDTSGLSRSEVVSKQLSHNAIAGVDNDQILGELFAEIDNLDDMIRSAINPEELAVDDPYDAIALDAVRIAASIKTITLQFYDTQTDDIAAFLECVPKHTDEVWLLPDELLEGYQKALAGVDSKLNVKSPSAAFAKLVEIALDYLEFVPEVQAAAKQTKKAASRMPRQRPKSGSPHAIALEALRKARDGEVTSVVGMTFEK